MIQGLPKAKMISNFSEIITYALITAIAIYMINAVNSDPELSGKSQFALLKNWSFNYKIATRGPIFIKQADGSHFNILGAPEVAGGPPRVWIILNAENSSDIYAYPRVYLYPDNMSFVLSCEDVNKLQSMTTIKPHVRMYLDSNCRVTE